jgi:hypothetical protein
MIVKDRTLIMKDRPVMHFLIYPVAQQPQQAEQRANKQQQTDDEKDHGHSRTDGHR